MLTVLLKTSRGPRAARRHVLRSKRGRVRRMPAGQRIEREMKRAFERQRGQVLKRIERNKSVRKGLPEVFVAIEEWLTAVADEETQRMLWDSKPLIEIYVADEGRAVLGRVGASDQAFDVKDPQVQNAIETLSFRFSKATNETTSRYISDAVKDLRASIGQGLDVGESIDQLSERVNEVFDQASRYRARRIARTEASRAVHLGQQLGAEQSGVVAAKQWVASTDGCPYCMALHGTQVSLRETFFHGPRPGPYSETPFPPAHPHCRCDLIEVLADPYA